MIKLKKTRALIVLNSILLSKTSINSGKYSLYSDHMAGVIVQKILNGGPNDFQMGDFKFHGIVSPNLSGLNKLYSHLKFIVLLLLIAIKEHKKEPFDCIITYDPFNAGLLGLLLKKMLEIKLIVEVNGNYGERKCWSIESKLSLNNFKYYYCQFMVPFVLNRCDGVKLLYPQQLEAYKRKITNKNIQTFHEYVPINGIKPSGRSDGYVLFLGAPWFMKGVDLLIRAYKEISEKHAGTLRIVGWMSAEDREYLLGLAGNCEQISIEVPVFYDEALSLIDGCEFLVLPSRTEAMGRVLLEAMAFRKAVIASNTDGIPHYVQNNINGLLFESGDWKNLQLNLQRLITDKELSARLAEEGKRLVERCYSEQVYLNNYIRLIGTQASRKNFC